MKIPMYELVFPGGDTQEIEHRLRFGQLVDMNGRPLGLPLRSTRILAFRVSKISSEDTLNEEITRFHLEQVYPDELAAYT